MLTRLEIAAGRHDHGRRPDLGAARHGLDLHDPAAVVGRQAGHGGAGAPVHADDGRARLGRRLCRRPTREPEADDDDVGAAGHLLTACAKRRQAGDWPPASQSQEPRRCFSTAETAMARSAAMIRATSRLHRLP